MIEEKVVRRIARILLPRQGNWFGALGPRPKEFRIELPRDVREIPRERMEAANEVIREALGVDILHAYGRRVLGTTTVILVPKINIFDTGGYLNMIGAKIEGDRVYPVLGLANAYRWRGPEVYGSVQPPYTAIGPGWLTHELHDILHALRAREASAGTIVYRLGPRERIREFQVTTTFRRPPEDPESTFKKLERRARRLFLIASKRI